MDSVVGGCLTEVFHWAVMCAFRVSLLWEWRKIFVLKLLKDEDSNLLQSYVIDWERQSKKESHQMQSQKEVIIIELFQMIYIRMDKLYIS